MPNIKSAEKRVLVTSVKTLRNRMIISSLKTAIKKFELACSAGDKEKAGAAMIAAVKTIDKAAAKGIIHKNNASRKKSNIALRYNKLISA